MIDVPIQLLLQVLSSNFSTRLRRFLTHVRTTTAVKSVNMRAAGVVARRVGVLDVLQDYLGC